MALWIFSVKCVYRSTWSFTPACFYPEKASVEPNENPDYLYHNRHSLQKPWCWPTVEHGECLPLSSRTLFRHSRIIMTSPMEKHIYQGFAANYWFLFSAVYVQENRMAFILKFEVIVVQERNIHNKNILLIWKKNSDCSIVAVNKCEKLEKKLSQGLKELWRSLSHTLDA